MAELFELAVTSELLFSSRNVEQLLRIEPMPLLIEDARLGRDVEDLVASSSRESASLA